MLEAVRRVANAGFKTAALTNTWSTGDEVHAAHELKGAFDVYQESCRTGMRKPEPAFYELACSELELEPEETVYLDELGANLKPARKLGMTTIKVERVETALGELGTLLGIDLIDATDAKDTNDE